MKERIKQNSNRVDPVTKLEDDANAKAALLNAVRRVPPGFFLKNGFGNEDISTFQLNLEKRLLKQVLTVSQHRLRELAVEVLRDTMKRLGIEKAGVRDDFREALEDIMRIDTHA